MSRKKIVIRADSSHTRGIGHVMRCLGLAEELRRKKFEVFFFTRKLEGNIADKIRACRFDAISFNASNIKDDLNFVKKTMKKIGSTFIIIDNYDIGFEYEKALFDDTGVRILSLDGLHRKHFCHIFVNPNIYATVDSCKKTVSNKCSILAGYKYLILRDDFLRLKKPKKVNNIYNKLQILVTLGGADPDNRTVDILNTLHEFGNEEFKIDVVVGPANKHIGTIQKFMSKHCSEGVTLHINPSNLCQLIKNCGLCICAGGITMGEALFLNKPIIGISLVDNQRKTIQFLFKRGLIFHIKDVSSSSEKLKSLVQRILKNRDLLKQMINKSKNLIDGRGRERIVKNILMTA